MIALAIIRRTGTYFVWGRDILRYLREVCILQMSDSEFYLEMFCTYTRYVHQEIDSYQYMTVRHDDGQRYAIFMVRH